MGESILLENGSFLINEDYIIGDKNVDKTAQNEFITQQVTSENILDFSEKNPFGDAGA